MAQQIRAMCTVAISRQGQVRWRGTAEQQEDQQRQDADPNERAAEMEGG